MYTSTQRFCFILFENNFNNVLNFKKKKKIVQKLEEKYKVMQ